MRYVSLDIETTGLDPKRCQVLQLAMVLEDTEYPDTPILDLPHWCEAIHWKGLHGEPYAFSMHSKLLKLCADGERSTPPIPFYDFAECWLQDHDVTPDNRITVAGKNVAGFDLRFLPDQITGCFHHRCLDPGSVFVDWDQQHLLSLGDLIDAKVAHDALQDARDVIKVLRRSYA